MISVFQIGRPLSTLCGSATRGHVYWGDGLGETVSLAEPDGSEQALAAAEARWALRAHTPRVRKAVNRGRFVVRGLRAADVIGLTFAFVFASLFFTSAPQGDRYSLPIELLLFSATLPVWVALASVYGLYARDEVGPDHTTADEVLGIVNLVTLGTWIVLAVGWSADLAGPELSRVVSFWLAGIVAIVGARAIMRNLMRRNDAYVQRALIIGAGDVGQLVARKIAQHPEYAIELVGFVDDDPRAARSDVEVKMLGGIDSLAELVEQNDVDRVIIAFSGEPDERTLALVRLLPLDDVIVDVVPRLFELIGPRASIHSIEGLPVVALPPTHFARGAVAAKRVIDVLGACVALVLTAPLFAYIALRIKRDSQGSVFFRQTRLGYGMRPFTVLKFRTMSTGTGDSMHRDYIRSTMSSRAELGENGVYKLDRADSITKVGGWLRRSSLDELPQLINVLRGEMSLVGPRPCIPYEVENFQPHHFERFHVPQGLTGLWQVSARSSSTFGEAIEMDVAYARGWSLGLDLRLLFRTPFALRRQRKATT